MDFKVTILPDELISQVKRERYDEESSKSTNIFDCVGVSVKEEFNDHDDSGLVNDSDEHELLTDIVKEEYIVTYPVASDDSVEFEHEVDIKQSLSLSPRNSFEHVGDGTSTSLEFNLMCSKQDDKHFECFSCRQTFKTLDQLKKHLNRQCFRSFECEICRRKFKCDAYLKTHKLTHVPGGDWVKKDTNKPKENQLFICTDLGCNKTFSRKDRLLVHMRIHTGDKRYQCDEDGCGKKFNEWSNMEKHRRIHFGDKRYTCDEPGCGKKFTAKCNLMEHQRIHLGKLVDKETGSKNGGKPFICEICGTSIRYSSSYRKHLQIHSGEKPHVCDYEGCNKRFARRYRLTHHKSIHTGEKPFLCDQLGCDRKFRDKSAFKKHVKTHN